MDAEQRDLLLSMAYLYSACDRERRALPLLLLVAAERPTDRDCLRALAHAYTAANQGDLAMAVIERLETLDDEPHSRGLLLLRSRALHAQSRLPEARACFLRYATAPNPARTSGQNKDVA